MHPAHKRLGVEAFVPEEAVDNVPSCPHGPMLMFERYFESKPSRKFYSCSAFRNRKDCSFFHWVDEKDVSDTCKEVHKKIITASRPPFNSHQCWKRLQAIQSFSESERSYCQSCNQLLLPKEHKKHKDHGVTCGISDKNLASPSHFIAPLEKKQTFAQYLFNDSTVDFFLKTFQRLGFKNLVCIGAPRIHEAIQSKESHNLKGMDSLLLDLDHRYAQFNDETHFIHYNMFNHHFFDKDTGKLLLQKFIQKSSPKSIAIVMDPPFGGLVQVLAISLKKLWKLACFRESKAIVEPPTFWVFPYFMQAHILEQLPSFAMCDYRVAYDNHPLYKKHHSQGSKTSPVRIFTNIPTQKIVLAEEEGYRYCNKCERYVSESNVHCELCNDCTSKDGRVWVHCKQCNRCVKKGRIHCQSCNRCEIPVHDCERSIRGCHVCGSMDHKRRNCPKKSGQDASGKRKQSQAKSNSKSKRRKTSKE